MSKRNADYVGRKYGRLTVIDRAEDYISPKGWHDSRWVCQCECGNTIEVRGLLLRNGHTTSCGCYQSESVSKYNKETKTKYNKYDLSNEYGIGYTDNYDAFGRNYFYFDLEDYDKIKDHCWHFHPSGYLYTNTKIDDSHKKRTNLKLHRVILGLTKFEDVADHIHGENSRFDNRKSNLRIATRRQNNTNRKISSNNTTGITGVYYKKDFNKWYANINVGICKTKFLGYFENKEDAIKARKEAEKKYYGEYAYDYSQAL